jgi:hypothetical protein
LTETSARTTRWIESPESVTAELSVVRGLNEMRLAVLGILVTIGLTIGFGVDGPWWSQLGAGGGSFVFSALLIKLPRSRHLMMSFMHWLTRA